MTRTRIAAAIAVVILAVALGLGSPAWSQGKSLTLSMLAGYKEDVLRANLPEFEKKSGIKVVVDAGAVDARQVQLRCAEIAARFDRTLVAGRLQHSRRCLARVGRNQEIGVEPRPHLRPAVMGVRDRRAFDADRADAGRRQRRQRSGQFAPAGGVDRGRRAQVGSEIAAVHVLREHKVEAMRTRRRDDPVVDRRVDRRRPPRRFAHQRAKRDLRIGQHQRPIMPSRMMA